MTIGNQDGVPWKKVNKGGEPYDLPSFLAGGQLWPVEQEWDPKYGSLTETWRQMSEYKEGFWRRNCYQNNPPKIEIRDYLILAEF